MNGTTLCPHCGTRFKISREQFLAHNGMVRCGKCLQAFDTRPHFTPEEPEELDPQLELPILDEADLFEEDLIPADQHQVDLEVFDESLAMAGEDMFDLHIDLEDSDITLDTSQNTTIHQDTDDSFHTHDILDICLTSDDQSPTINVRPYTRPVEDNDEFLSKPRSKFWAIAFLPMLFIALLQATYLFRVEIASRFPSIKPELVIACELVKCAVPLPQHINLMSIESSELKDNPGHPNEIILIALLRNRASFAQALPNLELTLTGIQDNVLARRSLSPADYLNKPETASIGLPANQELGINLRLDTSDLNPIGYRLVLIYPAT